MFFAITDKVTEIEPANIDPNILTVGIVTSEELSELGPGFGFDEDTIAASKQANHLFRTGVEVRDDYTFAELRIVNTTGADDFISVFLKKNFLLVVDILDADNSTRDSFIDSNLMKFKNLMGYFLLRHDNDFYLAAISSRIIAELCVANKMTMEDVARMYSAEIEYSDINCDLL